MRDVRGPRGGAKSGAGQERGKISTPTKKGPSDFR